MTVSTNVSIELANEDALMVQPDISAFLRNLDISKMETSSNNDNTKSMQSRVGYRLAHDHSEAQLEDSELHFDAEKGDMIFDYGSQEISATPDKIGEHISQLLESVLPAGLQKEAQRKLKEMMNKDQFFDTDGESSVRLQDAITNLQRIQNVKQLRQLRQNAGELAGANSKFGREHRNKKETHSVVGATAEKPSNYREFPRRPPNFSVLITQKTPVCLFCEYHMVFGEPPRNMIKWYNRVNRYEDLPQDEDKKSRHSRKRNR
ncbi:uncharacterized protein ZBAI_06268 [Zygosaccharomyces bailii ISA1307]|nr:uncharacterized protein ZBAI_06268 [Zygosaccharomyces bailii ISA1307]